MIQITLSPSDIDRITDALEILANNYGTANMARAREACILLRANVIRQSMEQLDQKSK